MNVIMKFGGTSVADADAITRVLAIVRRQLDEGSKDTPPVVVVSAMSKVTDRLIETGRLAREGQADAAPAGKDYQRVKTLILGVGANKAYLNGMQPPTDWMDFANPKKEWQNQITFYDPRTSSAAFSRRSWPRCSARRRGLASYS